MLLVVTKGLRKRLVNFEMRGWVETTQTTTLLRSVLKTWGNLLSLKLQWKRTSWLKNFQGVNKNYNNNKRWWEKFSKENKKYEPALISVTYKSTPTLYPRHWVKESNDMYSIFHSYFRFGLAWFYGMTTSVGCLVPYQFLYMWAVLFRIINFNMSTICV